MRFVGLDPFEEQQPVVEVGSGIARIDLHNDATLRDISINLATHELRLVWTLRVPAWQSPGRPEPESRETIGCATLVFTGIGRLRISGLVVGEASEGLGVLDFIEYRRLAPGRGELLLSFLNHAEMEVTASCCELRRVDSA